MVAQRILATGEGLVQIRHGQNRFSLPVDALLKAGRSGSGAPGMPEVAHQEEEGQNKLGPTQPLAEVHVVHRVGLGDDAAHGVDGGIGGMGHVLRCTTHLPGLNVVLQLLQAEAVGTTQRLQPWATEIPEAHGLTAKDDLTGGRAHQILAQAGWPHGRTDVGAQALVPHQEGEGLGLGGLSIGGTPEFGRISGVVEPDERGGDEAHQAQGAQAVAQVGFTVPDEGPAHPAKGLGEHMPDAAKDAGDPQPDVATDNVFHIVHPDNPALAPPGGTAQVAEDDRRIQGWIGDHAHVSTARSPGVVHTTKEHGLEDQQEAAHPQENQVIANDVGHLILVAPVLGKEDRIVLQNVRTAQGMVEAADAQDGRGHQMQYTHHKERVETGHLAAGPNPVAQKGHVGEAEEALLVHGLVGGIMTHLEEHHGSGPEDHQARVGNMGAQKAAGKIDEAGVSSPPSVAGGVLVQAAAEGRIRERYHVGGPLQGIGSVREAGRHWPSRRGCLR